MRLAHWSQRSRKGSRGPFFPLRQCDSTMITHSSFHVPLVLRMACFLLKSPPWNSISAQRFGLHSDPPTQFKVEHENVLLSHPALFPASRGRSEEGSRPPSTGVRPRAALGREGRGVAPLPMDTPRAADLPVVRAFPTELAGMVEAEKRPGAGSPEEDAAVAEGQRPPLRGSCSARRSLMNARLHPFRVYE